MATFNQRNITEFRSRLSGGGARANLFEVEIAFPEELGINLTDVSTRDVDSLRDCFKNQYITIYNLSDKDRSIMSIPFSILSKLKNTKLLIF